MKSKRSTSVANLSLVSNNDAQVQSHERVVIIAQPEVVKSLELSIFLREFIDISYSDDIHSFLLKYHSINNQQRQLVLLDANLLIHPTKDLCLLLGQLASSNYALVLLVSHHGNDFIATCMALGADDFFCLNASFVLLDAKISAHFRRLQSMNVGLTQLQEYSKHTAQALHEQSLAKAVFDRVTDKYDYDLSLIDAWLSPAAIFNGDILLKAIMPNGGLIVLLGDFTGHGLTAAIGAMPLASSFYAMVDKGFSMGDIIHELNDKLYDLLPSNIFCCAAAVQFDFSRATVDVWNGGLPDVVIQRHNNVDFETVVSSQLPLGVVSNSTYPLEISRLSMSVNDRVWLLSDGLLEASNAQGHSFGADRFLAILKQSSHLASPIEFIKRQFASFNNHAAQADDVSLVQISMLPEIDFLALQPSLNRSQGAVFPSAWCLSLTVYPASLKYSDPIPQLLHQLMELPAMRPYNHCLFTVFTELYNNALDHGLLGLVSELKSDLMGFEHFYARRKQALAALDSGWVKLSVEFTADQEGATIQLDVEDSGAGFDLSHLKAGHNLDGSEDLSSAHKTRIHGRGIALVDSLCDRLDYLGCGNHAQAFMSLRFQ